MKTVSPALKAHLEGEVTTLAVLWHINRLDGMEFFFTDHTEDLTYLGNTYVASTGFFRSAMSNTSAPDGGDLEVSGMLDAEGIVEQDLMAGKFDYAEVSLRLVNYEDLTMGHLPLRFGRFGEAQVSQTGKFTIELRGLVDQLSTVIGDTYSPDCRTDLFSAKCKLTASALPRVAGKTYKVGDRVTVPTAGSASAYAVPFPNLSFQDLQYADSSVWAVSNMIARIPPGANVRVFSPTDWVSSIHQTIAVSAFTETGTTTPQCTASVRIAVYGSDLQLRIRFSYLDEGFNEIGSAASAYSTLDRVETRTLTETVPLGTRHVVWWVETRRKPGSAEVLFDQNADSVLFNPSFTISTSSNLIADPQLLTFTLGTATLNGWSGAYFSARQTHRGYSGPEGKMFMINTSGGENTVTSGPVSLVGGSVSEAEIDTGDFVVDLGWWQANLDLSGKADLRLVFFGPTLAAQGVAENFDLQEVMPVGDWKNRKREIVVPAGARSVSLQIRLDHSRNDVLGAVQAGVGDISVSLRSRFDLGFSFPAYEGVEYVAQSPGNAAATEAFDWSRTLGATVVDGGVTWQAVVPRFSNLTTVSAVTSRGIFTLGAEVDRPDDYFQWGLIVFITGRNAGFSADITKWTASTKRLELAMPLPFLPQAGDQVWVQVGCDKRIETCHAKFGNAINFRGEPWLPGTDQYFKVGSPV